MKLNSPIPCPDGCDSDLIIAGVVQGKTYLGCRSCSGIWRVEGNIFERGLKLVKARLLRLIIKSTRGSG